MKCTVCHKSYKERHTCHGGRCPQCTRHVLDLRKHLCPVTKLQCIRTEDVVQLSLERGKTCEGCHEHHPCIKNINGFRTFKGFDFCADCYTIPPITQETNALRQQLYSWDILSGNIDCVLCGKIVLNPQTVQPECRFERDHIDITTKTDCVGRMILDGARFDLICTEARKCRILCVRCHSVVTFAERYVGSIRYHTNKQYNQEAQTLVENIVCTIIASSRSYQVDHRET